MTIWQDVEAWFTTKAQHLQHLTFPDPKAPPETVPILPQKHYFRLWLCEMFLTDSAKWFRTQYPTVTAEVQLKFGNVERQPFTRVAGPKKNQLGRGVYESYPLTELLPFQGGTVGIEVGLLALQGDSSLLGTIALLESFSQLVAAPLGQALTLATRVTNGVESIFKSTQGQVHLGFHQTYSAAGGGGERVLSPGYVAVIGAPAAALPPGDLGVVNGQLCRRGIPLEGIDYLLFRIEGRVERDDWPRDIEEPFRDAQEALELGETERADASKKAAISAVFRSTDLTPVDRRRMIKTIKDQLNLEAADGHNAVGTERRTLREAFQLLAPKPEAVEFLGELTAAEAFGPSEPTVTEAMPETAPEPAPEAAPPPPRERRPKPKVSGREARKRGKPAATKPTPSQRGARARKQPKPKPRRRARHDPAPAKPTQKKRRP